MENQIIILGGMGPQASAHLHSLIVKEVGRNKAPDDFPLILHVSIPTPDFIASPERVGDAVKVIQDVSAQMPMQTASAVGLACNTAHLLIDRLTNIPQGAFVSMIEATADTVQRNGYKKVGLLASPFTIKSKLYHEALSKRGIEVVQPSSTDISKLNTIIHNVVGNTPPESMRTELSEIAHKLEARNVNCILLGCTELPLVGIDSSLTVVDSLSCLAEAMLQKHKS